MTRPEVPYAGVATRAVALAIDAAIAQLIVFTGGAILALVGSLVADIRLDTSRQGPRGRRLDRRGGHVLRAVLERGGADARDAPDGLRVMTRAGEHPGVGRSVVRVIGLGLAIVPLFLGFPPVLVDARRRGPPDFMARTVVVYDGLETPPPPEPVTVPALGEVQPS